MVGLSLALVPGCATSTAGGTVQISAGAVHSCAVSAAGTVECWGLNSSGDLGLSESADSFRATPNVVPALSDAVEVRCGDLHSCARRWNGSVVCWGNNSYGQLGIGTLDGDAHPTPVVVSGVSDAVELAAGHHHTCARTARGTVLCWGLNTNGELRDDATRASSCDGFGPFVVHCAPVPVEVSGVHDATGIAAGLWFSCALRATGTVTCWGALRGEWPGVTDAVQIVATQGNPLVRTASGTVESWADGGPPFAIPDLTDAVHLGAGEYMACAARATGASVCWEHRYVGLYPPEPVPDIDDAVEVAVGQWHACARRASGSVVCWGRNAHGELGDGTTVDATSPTSVLLR